MSYKLNLEQKKILLDAQGKICDICPNEVRCTWKDSVLCCDFFMRNEEDINDAVIGIEKEKYDKEYEELKKQTFLENTLEEIEERIFIYSQMTVDCDKCYQDEYMSLEEFKTYCEECRKSYKDFIYDVHSLQDPTLEIFK